MRVMELGECARIIFVIVLKNNHMTRFRNEIIKTVPPYSDLDQHPEFFG